MSDWYGRSVWGSSGRASRAWERKRDGCGEGGERRKCAVYLWGWEVGREEDRVWESDGGEGGFVPLVVAIADEVVETRESRCAGTERYST